MRAPISVVVTCYDLGATIDEALDSVYRQTRPAAELIVIDDGSTDADTRRVLARLRRRGVRVVRTVNRGVSAARNLGARLAVGDYLVCLDADDAFEPTYFEVAAGRLDEEPGLDFVTCPWRAFEGASFVWTPSPLNWVDVVSTGGAPHVSTLIRRRVWNAIGGYDESFRSYEELDFWVTVLERGFQGLILDEPLLRYRVRAGSNYHQAVERETYLDRMRRFYAKHDTALAEHGAELIVGREGFIVSQRAYARSLDAQQAAIEAELAALDDEIASLGGAVEQHGRAPALEIGADEAPMHVEVTSTERATIVMYHRIARLDPDPHELCVSPADFRAHMESLRRDYHPMSLEDLARAAEAGRIPARAVAVTLDDGYLDALTSASPILLETGIPATFFVNSADLDEEREALWDTIDRFFRSGLTLPPRLELDVRGERVRRPTTTAAECEAAAAWLHGLATPMNARERQALVRRLVEWSGIEPTPRPTHRRLTAAELVRLAERPGHAIGSHTVHHLVLPCHDRETQRWEIEADRRHLERGIGRPVRTLAYPYGEFSAVTVEVARAAGVTAAVTCRETLVPAGGDPLLLPRLAVKPAGGATLSLPR
jgi:glycosyltransferase involved in cell wall biosynthesis/peptidoglycan/xylan/chitin deacetylase (PgdA/CDA1 family)